MELHWAISSMSWLNINLLSIRKLSGAPLGHFLHFQIKAWLEIYMKMIWSSAGPIPSVFNLRLVRNIIENYLELHCAMSFTFNLRLLRNLIMNDLALHLAISFILQLKLNKESKENALELHWGISFICN